FGHRRAGALQVGAGAALRPTASDRGGQLAADEFDLCTGAFGVPEIVSFFGLSQLVAHFGEPLLVCCPRRSVEAGDERSLGNGRGILPGTGSSDEIEGQKLLARMMEQVRKVEQAFGVLQSDYRTSVRDGPVFAIAAKYVGVVRRSRAAHAQRYGLR